MRLVVAECEYVFSATPESEIAANFQCQGMEDQKPDRPASDGHNVIGVVSMKKICEVTRERKITEMCHVTVELPDDYKGLLTLPDVDEVIEYAVVDYAEECDDWEEMDEDKDCPDLTGISDCQPWKSPDIVMRLNADGKLGEVDQEDDDLKCDDQEAGEVVQ